MSWPRARRYLPRRAGDDREDDVVDRAAVSVLDPLQLGRGRPAVMARRRWGPISTLKAVLGADMPAPIIFEVPPSPLQRPGAARGSAARTPRTISRGLVARSRSASPSSCRSVGSGRASHGGASGGPCGSASRSKRTVVMSTPETPSTSAWWLLPTIAKRPPSQPLDQPQLPERLRAVELLGEDPRGEVAQLLLGAGRRQRGLAHVVVEVEVGVVDPDRAALVEAARSAASGGSAGPGAAARRCGRGTPRASGGGPSKMLVEATCMWAPARSIWRKEESSPVSRSSPPSIFAQRASPGEIEFSASTSRLHALLPKPTRVSAAHRGAPDRFLRCLLVKERTHLPNPLAPATGERGTHMPRPRAAAGANRAVIRP